MLLPNFEYASDILSFVISVLWNNSRSCFHVKCFACLFPWRVFILFVTTTFFIYIKFPFAKSWLSLDCLQLGSCQHAQVSHFSTHLFLSNSYFTSSIIIHHLFASLWFLFWMPIFVKCHMGFITGRQGSNWTVPFIVCGWTKLTDMQWPITDRLRKKWSDWSLI